eukprot:scaffold207_cov345-Pavlova_lutheri.AAC.2
MVTCPSAHVQQLGHFHDGVEAVPQSFADDGVGAGIPHHRVVEFQGASVESLEAVSRSSHEREHFLRHEQLHQRPHARVPSGVAPPPNRPYTTNVLAHGSRGSRRTGAGRRGGLLGRSGDRMDHVDVVDAQMKRPNESPPGHQEPAGRNRRPSDGERKAHSQVTTHARNDRQQH